MLLAARDAGVARFIYASSSAVYGDHPAEEKIETLAARPLSPYAATKQIDEVYAEVFARCYGLNSIGLRYFNVFGPRQDPSSQYSGVVSRFISTLLSDERPVIFGDGEQSRDFTYIDNVVSANLKAANSSGGVGMVVNIANGDRITLNALLAELKDLTGRNDVTAEYHEPRVGDVRHSLADISRARELLGYEPIVGLREGLQNTIEWWKSSRFAVA